MRIGQLSDDISGLANKQKNLGAERKFVRVGRKKPDLTKSSLVNASESVNVEGVGLKANQLRQSGKAPSLTETRQNTKGTPEEFMAAWDTLHPRYGKPTNGFGEAENDPVRNAVREKIRGLLDENGQLPPGYRDGLKRKLAQAQFEGRILGPDDIGNDPNDSLRDDLVTGVADSAKFTSQLPALAGEGLAAPVAQGLGEHHPVTEAAKAVGENLAYFTPLGGPMAALGSVAGAAEANAEGGNVAEAAVNAIPGVGQVKTLFDPNAPREAKIGAVVGLLFLGGGAAVHAAMKGDYANATKHLPESEAKAVQNTLSDPAFDREAFTKQLQSQEGPLEVGQPPKINVRATSAVSEPVKSTNEGVSRNVQDKLPGGNPPRSDSGANPEGNGVRETVTEGTGNGQVIRGRVADELGGQDAPVQPSQQIVRASTTAEPSTSSPVRTETPKNTLRIGRRSQAVQESPEKPGPSTQPESTGLANQVNEREAVAGVIESIPSAKGKSAEEWQRLGKDEVDKGADYRALAKQVGDGKSLEPLDVGILTEGKRQLLNEVNKAKATLDAKPGDKEALEKLNQAQAELDQYLKDIQAGKGKASDVFRALQAGTQLDTGNFADVIQAARRTGHSNEKIEAELSKQADEIAGLKEEVERLRSNPREHDAKQALASVRSRRYDRTSLESNIKANREKLSQLRGSGGVGAGKKRGAASVITAEDLKVAKDQLLIVKDIALDYARLHVGAKIEDIVLAFKNDGVDIERDAVVMALSHTEPSKPQTEQAASAASVRGEAKRIFNAKARLAEAEGQLRTGIRVAKTKKPRTVTEEIADLEARIRLKDKRVKQRLMEMEGNPTLRTTRKLFKGIQSLKLGSDIGTVRRQGQFFIKHPKLALESVSEAWQAAKSDLAMSKWQDKWDEAKYSDGRSAARVEHDAGLLTPDVVTGHEEMVALRWLKELGGERLSEASGALERFQKVYINHARKAYFRMNVEAGLNAEALKDVARYTNNVSGRGNLKETGSALSKLAEVVLTSRNYEASRWGTLAEPVRNVARLLQKNKGHEPGWKEGAKSNLKDLAKQTAVMGGAVYLASQMGYKPDNGDWSKLRRYKRDEKGEFTIPTDEVHDWTAGLGPRMRDTIQLMAAAVNPTYRQNIGAELNQILKRTFSAGITTPLAIGSSANQRRLGVKEPINPLTGFKMDEYEDTWKALLPLIAASTAQAENDMGAKAGTFLDEFTGGGVNFYPKEKPKTVSVGRRSSERSRERT